MYNSLPMFSVLITALILSNANPKMFTESASLPCNGNLASYVVDLCKDCFNMASKNGLTRDDASFCTRGLADGDKKHSNHGEAAKAGNKVSQWSGDVLREQVVIE